MGGFAAVLVAVFRVFGAFGAFGALGVFGFAAAGCVDVRGGSIEVPWAIFAHDGRGVINDCSCADPTIAAVRLALAAPVGAPPVADPCEGVAGCQFACGRKIGATPFFIPPGSYQISIEPIGADGTPIPMNLVATTSSMPAQVVFGQPSELDAFEIDAACAPSCHGDDITVPCS
jgi:hypothetical protein